MKPNRLGSDAREDISATNPSLHLVCSSGGSRAILGGAGAILAVDQAGLKNLASIGGVSGGSLPTLIYSAGISARETLRHAVNIDFASMLTRRANIFSILFAYFRKGRLACTRPNNGVMTSEPLGEYVNAMIEKAHLDRGVKHHWPKGYWTMAVVGDSQVLFDETGVYEVKPDGSRITLSDKPASLGTAVRASCAVPGIISAVPYKGRFLFDGALSLEGRCPIAVPMANNGATAEQIIAIDAGEETDKRSKRLQKVWRFLAGKNCVPLKHEKVVSAKDVAVLVKPDLSHFPSLKFTLTRDQKWLAVMAGYVACVEALTKSNLIEEAVAEPMQAIVTAFNGILSAWQPSEVGRLADLTEKLLRSAGLF